MKKYYSGMFKGLREVLALLQIQDVVSKSSSLHDKGDIVNVTAVGKKYHFQELLALGYY